MSNERDDDSQKAGLWVVFGIVGLVVAGVVGYAVIRSLNHGTTPVAVTAPQVESSASAASAAPQVGDVVAVSPWETAVLTSVADGKLYFEVDQAQLPPDAVSVLDKVVQMSTSKPQATVVLSGFHDETGDPARNAELAKNRAVAVRDELVRRGLAQDRIFLRKPVVTTGSGSNEEARRVEIRVLDAVPVAN